MPDGSGRHKAQYRYGYARSADQDMAVPAHHAVVVVGAGPVGLTVALDLAQRGLAVVLLDDSDRIGEGSRGICWAKRTLEIWDRLGVAAPMVAKGVTWKLGKVFLGNDPVYSFDLLPEDGHKMPAFINLQQYFVERVLVDRVSSVGAIDLRWKNKVVGVERGNEGVRLTVDTPDGAYRVDADWVVAADGARSSVRDLLGLGFAGVTFDEKFLIADITMAADLPTERRFWFDPPFHSGQSALMHRQPDNVWRIDLQLGRDADVEEEQRPERVLPRLREMLGDRAFELQWVSIYRFNCRRLDNFVHGRVVFVGDAAHQVSPFGARGANSGVQDAENLAWKLAAVIAGQASERLLGSYDSERAQAAEENIGHSTRSTDFIAPRSAAERSLRNAVLSLAPRAEFARRMVNSGRLSMATVHDRSSLSTDDAYPFSGSAQLGAPAPDAPVRSADGRDGFLLEHLGSGFDVLHVKHGARPEPPLGVRLIEIGEDLVDDTGLFRQRFDATPDATYVLRPDQHLAARFRRFDARAVGKAVEHALVKA